MTDDLVNIRTFSNVMDASMAQQILEQSDISSFVSADDAGGMAPPLQFSMGVRLMVNRADAGRAIEILRSIDV
jgi:hypothetical protein